MSKYLYNPLNRAISTTYDTKGDRILDTLTLEPESITEFTNETHYRHMCDFLVDAVLDDRGIVHFDANREKIRKEVEKNYD